MISHRHPRSGAVWLELLLILAIVILLFQLFPGILRKLADALDFRYWSHWTWFLANLIILLLLLSVRFGPDLAEAWRQRLKSQDADSSPREPTLRIKPDDDVRVLMRRDEQLRARLRRKMTLYCLVIPAVIVVASMSLGWWRDKIDKSARARNTFLSANAGDQFHDKTEGTVGLVFQVRPDLDVQVARIGVYDHKANGLNLAHRVGIFRVATGQSKSELVVEATIPYGREAPLEEGFRWASLDRPVTLRAGHAYILAAESFAEVGDDWPAAFDKTGSVGNQRNPAWNPALVGDHPDVEGKLLMTDRPWPAVPDRNVATDGRVPHGLANIVVADGQ